MSATILYLHSSSDLYGSDRSLLRTIKCLDAAAYRAVVCLPYDGPLVEELRKAGAIVFVWNLGIMRRSVFTPWRLALFLSHVLRAVVKLWFLIRRYDVNLIHSNTSAVIAGGLVTRWFGIPHFWHVREIILTPAIVRKFIAWNLARGATKVLCVSDSVRENLLRDQQILREKAVVLHNGIDPAPFAGGEREGVRRGWKILEKEILVGMLGRVGTWKGEDLFLEVARRVVRTTTLPIRFVAVGSAFRGDEWKFERFQKSVLEAALGDRFLIEPFRTDVPDVLAALDVFVLPSVLPDPFPTIVLEAMAAGKAIVANGHGGVSDMLENGKHGYLVTPNDAAMMARRIEELAHDAGLRAAFGHAAKNRVQELFNLTRYNEAINKLYQAALGGTFS